MMAERRLRSSKAVVGSSELQSARDRSQLSLSGPRLALSHNEPPPAKCPLLRHRPSCIIPITLLSFAVLSSPPLSVTARCRQSEMVCASREIQEMSTRSQNQRGIERTQQYSHRFKSSVAAWSLCYHQWYPLRWHQLSQGLPKISQGLLHFDLLTTRSSSDPYPCALCPPLTTRLGFRHLLSIYKQIIRRTYVASTSKYFPHDLHQ